MDIKEEYEKNHPLGNGMIERTSPVMDIRAEYEKTLAQRNALLSQLVKPLQELAALNGKLSVLEQLLKEQEQDKEKKTE